MHSFNIEPQVVRIHASGTLGPMHHFGRQTSSVVIIWTGPQGMVPSSGSVSNSSVLLCDQFTLIYAFPSLKLLPHLLCRIEIKDFLMVLVAPDWPRRTW